MFNVTCGVRGGVGHMWLEKSLMKGLFTASGSRGTKSLYWKARDAWDKTNEGNFHFKWYQLFVCVVPVRPLLSSIVDRLTLDWENSWLSRRHHWFSRKKTFKERPQTTHQYPDLSSASLCMVQANFPRFMTSRVWVAWRHQYGVSRAIRLKT